MKGVCKERYWRPATRGCFRSHVPFTPVFTLHGWLARHSGWLEKRNCHNCRNYFRLFPFAADWMENARCENLGLSRHHSGTQHNTTQSIYHPLSRKQRNERNMRDAGMFLLHIVTAAQQTLVLWWWHVLLLSLLRFMFMWPHDIQLRSPSVVYLVSPKNTDFLINYCAQ